MAMRQKYYLKSSSTLLIVKIDFILRQQNSFLRYIIFKHRSDFWRDSLFNTLFKVILFSNRLWVARLLSLGLITLTISYLLVMLLVLLLLLWVYLLFLLFLLILTELFEAATGATTFLIIWLLPFFNSERIYSRYFANLSQLS